LIKIKSKLILLIIRKEFKMKNKKTLDQIRAMKIPKHINFNDTKLLKKIISKSFLSEGNGKWYANGGYDILINMDNTIVGLS
jgi:hypothetical protein